MKWIKESFGNMRKGWDRIKSFIADFFKLGKVFLIMDISFLSFNATTIRYWTSAYDLPLRVAPQ